LQSSAESIYDIHWTGPLSATPYPVQKLFFFADGVHPVHRDLCR